GSLGKWLLLAVVLQAAIVRYVPQDWVISALGTADWWSVPAAALVGVPLYLNGVGAIPITEGLLTQGMLPGAAVTFLLAGAITTVPAMVAVRSVVRWGTFGFYVGVGFVGSIVIGLLAQPWL
ncbi:MAG: permease, partial [Dermatophilaceae bacterium]